MIEVPMKTKMDNGAIMRQMIAIVRTSETVIPLSAKYKTMGRYKYAFLRIYIEGEKSDWYVLSTRTVSGYSCPPR